MQLNYELLQQGVRIERILILCDFFWLVAALLPSADIRLDRRAVRPGNLDWPGAGIGY